MTTTLSAGANAPIQSLGLDNPNHLELILAWIPASVLATDVSAFLLNSSKQVRSPADHVTVGATQAAGVQLDMHDNRARLRLDLTQIEGGIERIAFTIAVGGAQRQSAAIGALQRLRCVVQNQDTPALVFEPATQGMTESALTVVEVYRHQGAWKIRAVGQGFRQGLTELGASFGCLGLTNPTLAPMPFPTAAPMPSPISGQPSGGWLAPSPAAPPAPSGGFGVPSTFAGGPPVQAPVFGSFGQPQDPLSRMAAAGSTIFAGFMSKLRQAQGQLTTDLGRFRNRTTMQAIIAGCAIIAAADGKIDAAEKDKMIGFIRSNDAMRVFDINEVLAFFTKTTDAIAWDANVGLGEAMQYVTKVKNTPEVGQLLVRVCCAIGAADGDFDPQEQNAVRGICQALNLNPREFGL